MSADASLADLSALPEVLTVPLPNVQPAKFVPLREQARPAPAQRYLLFDAAEASSLREQQATLLFFLDLAIALGRTLVLPRCRLRRLMPDGSPAPDATLVPWSDLFDLGALTALHPAVPIDAFIASHGRLDLLARATPDSCAPTTTETALTFNGLPDVRVLRSECGVQSAPTALLSSPHAAIGFSGSTASLGPDRAARLRPHVRFERGVYAEAASFVSEQLGAEPFVAVHWSAAPPADGARQNAHDVARHTRRLMTRRGVRRAFLATDLAERVELSQLHAKLKPLRYKRAAAPTHSLRELVVRDHVEVTICAMATYFLGTLSSNFSDTVLNERTAVFELDPTTAAHMDDDHNATVAPSDGRKPRVVHQLKDEL